MDHAAFADTPASRCAYYRRICGLPAGIHPEGGRIVVKAGVVRGITMPARLGQRVRDDMRLFAALFRLDVSIVPFGGEIALPSPAEASGGFRQWVVAPRDTFRPSGASIVDCVLACAGRKGAR
jgi:hypothetical protein